MEVREINTRSSALICVGNCWVGAPGTDPGLKAVDLVDQRRRGYLPWPSKVPSGKCELDQNLQTAQLFGPGQNIPLPTTKQTPVTRLRAPPIMPLMTEETGHEIVDLLRDKPIGGAVGWDSYELFRIGEQDSNFARDFFKGFIPLDVESPTRLEIIFNFFDRLSARAWRFRGNAQWAEAPEPEPAALTEKGFEASKDVHPVERGPDAGHSTPLPPLPNEPESI
ncbi:hypothetical protein B0H66DRAFT_538541 [Apodospora peruviana]|uniref:Meiotically up-regulated protein Msb1/Mug8 domain-containing protein n=1 Tax=Apodospora peruviana TaxID=516989 RepID=A0AAE0LY70_9PEZI|nr:hypothetical protein B0H66DRAFT_538541 [Apodospora peruviana]